MCGIAGFYHPQGKALGNTEEIIGRMGGVMDHRGPDDAGTYSANCYSFSFRRLFPEKFAEERSVGKAAWAIRAPLK